MEPQVGTFLIPDKCTEEMHSSELVKANYTGVPGASSECWWHNAAQAFNPQAEMPGISTTCVKSISHRIFNISLQKLNQIKNYGSFVNNFEFVSDLDQPGHCSFIRLEMAAI